VRRPSRTLIITASAALALVVIVVLVLLMPRYRTFYFGEGGPAWPPAPSGAGAAAAAKSLGSRAASAARAVAAAAPRQTFGLPLRLGNEPPPPGASDLPIVRTTKVRVPQPDSAGQIRVPITDVVPAMLPATQLPLGWDLKEFTGHAGVGIVRDGGHVAVRLQSQRSSFALYRDVVVDLKEYPMLQWSWKAIRLPSGGDARERATDDQVAQVYIVFPRWPFPRIHSDVVGYLWDTRAPGGEKVTSPQAPNVRSIVVESGYQKLGFWIGEERNVRRDYIELFGREPSRVGKIAIMTDSNDTRSESEALIDDLIFFRPPPRNAEIRNVYAKMPLMLREKS
jgi:hypothetical protein